MDGLTRRQAAASGFGWGCIAGLALVALMYLCGLVFGLRPLPQLLNEPLLSLVPGFVFGFLIDTLQHAGKVVEELGLIVAMVVGLGAVGAAEALTQTRRPWRYLPFVFAGVCWLVVTAVLLPVSGQGLLGLGAGPATPIIWAALFAVYAVILQMPAEAAPAVDIGRRRVLSALPLTIGAVSVGVLGLRLLPDWYAAIFKAPETSLHGVSPAITPVDSFYVVSKNFSDPIVDGQGWSLKIGGLVSNPQTLSLAELRALPAATEYVTLECVSNDVGGGLMSTGAFTGVSLRDLVASASPHGAAKWVAFTARDGYTESLPLSVVAGAPEVLVAYELDGAPLPAAHGYPARIVLPGHYGMKGPKWLDRIDLADHESGGYWEQQGWDHNAVVKTTARFDTPRDGDIVKLGGVSLAGVAFAGNRGVSEVEYSTDGGSTWRTAQVDAALSPYTWVLWRVAWTPPGEGAYRLVVRATDATGEVQSSQGSPSYPSGAGGYHAIGVNVSR